MAGQSPELTLVLSELSEAIKRDTLSDSFALVPEVITAISKSIKINEATIIIGVERV